MGPHCCLTSRQLLVLSGQEHTSPHLTSLFSGSRQKVTTSTNNHILYQGNDRALPTSICLLLTPQLDAQQHLDLSLEDQNIKLTWIVALRCYRRTYQSSILVENHNLWLREKNYATDVNQLYNKRIMNSVLLL